MIDGNVIISKDITVATLSENSSYWVRFYTSNNNSQDKDNRNEEKENNNLSVNTDDEELGIEFGAIELSVKRVTSAQGTRQRLRFCDGVSEEILLSLSRKERARQEAIFEFIQTEQNYVQDLRNFIEEFVKPLRERKILSEEEIYSICINIEDILPINQIFLEDLQKRQSESILAGDFSDIFLIHLPKLSVHIEYCSKHSFALKRVPDYSEKYEKFSEFLLQPKVSLKETLQGYLVKPFQRLTRYPMLIESILKNTPPDEDSKLSRVNLLFALQESKRMAHKANTALRLEEDRMKAIEVWNSLPNECADYFFGTEKAKTPKVSGRMFQKKLNNRDLNSKLDQLYHIWFYCSAVISRNNCASFDGMIFLYNDCLFIAKGREISSINPIQRIPLQDIRILTEIKKLTSVTDTNQRLSILHKKNRYGSISHSDKMSIEKEFENNIDSLVCLQSYWRMKKSILALKKLRASQKLLRSHLESMKTTESTFLDRMKILDELVTPLMNNDNLRTLFSGTDNLTTLISNSTKLVHCLSLLSDLKVLNSFESFLKILKAQITPLHDYIEDYYKILPSIKSMGQELIELISKREKTKQLNPGALFELLAEPPLHSSKLLSFLSGLIQCIPIIHQDYPMANEILNDIKEVQSLSESFRKFEKDKQQMQSVYSQLSQFEGLLDDNPTRRLIRQGNLTLIPEEGDKTVFLFNDICIIYDKSSNIIRNKVRLQDLKFVEFADLYFSLVDNRSKRSFVFGATKTLHKRRWCTDFTDAINQANAAPKKGGIDLRKPVRGKRSASVTEPTNTTSVVIRTGGDIWEFKTPENKKHEREFLEKLELAISSIFSEGLDKLAEENRDENILSSVKKAKKSLPAGKESLLLPLLNNLAKTAQNEKILNQYAFDYSNYKTIIKERSTIRYQFQVASLVQRPNSILHIPPKLITPTPIKLTKKASSRVNMATRRTSSDISRNRSESVNTTPRRPSIEEDIGHELRQLILKQQKQIESTNSRLELLDSQCNISSITISEQSSTIRVLEEHNRIWEGKYLKLKEEIIEETEKKWMNIVEEQKITIDLLQESVNKLMKDRERARRRKRRAKHKKNITASIDDSKLEDSRFEDTSTRLDDSDDFHLKNGNYESQFPETPEIPKIEDNIDKMNNNGSGKSIINKIMSVRSSRRDISVKDIEAMGMEIENTTPTQKPTRSGRNFLRSTFTKRPKKDKESGTKSSLDKSSENETNSKKEEEEIFKSQPSTLRKSSSLKKAMKTSNEEEKKEKKEKKEEILSDIENGEIKLDETTKTKVKRGSSRKKFEEKIPKKPSKRKVPSKKNLRDIEAKPKKSSLSQSKIPKAKSEPKHNI